MYIVYCIDIKIIIKLLVKKYYENNKIKCKCYEDLPTLNIVELYMQMLYILVYLGRIMLYIILYSLIKMYKYITNYIIIKHKQLIN